LCSWRSRDGEGKLSWASAQCPTLIFVGMQCNGWTGGCTTRHYMRQFFKFFLISSPPIRCGKAGC
jgi:hypothetical protein